MLTLLRFVRALSVVIALAALVWVASGIRWPALTDPNGDWFRFISQVSATLLGAGIATGVTWYFAEKKRRDEQRASLQRMFLRLMYMAADLTNLLRMIDEMLEEANTAGNSGLPLWARVKPIVGLTDPKDLDVAEMAPLFDIGEAALVNDAMLFSDKYQSNIASARTYNSLRLELRTLMTVDRKTDSGISVSELNKQEFEKLSPRFDELDQLVKALMQHLREDVPFGREVITRFAVAAKKATGAFPSVEFLNMGQSKER